MNSDKIIKRERKLKDEDDVFSQNAWDDTEWTSEMYNKAEERVKQQREESKSNVYGNSTSVSQVELRVTQSWDEFYKAHEDKFFKDRRWMFSEFPELLEFLKASSPPCNILEVGCGVGNAVVQIIERNHNPNLHIYCCDLSSNAINTLTKRDLFKKNAKLISAFQADACNDFDSIIARNVPLNSIDFMTLIFSMSAMKPELMQSTIINLSSLLKPDGVILFRDYAQYDLTQLRFKGKSYLRDNYYVRADGTTSYFFTKPIVDELFSSAGLSQVELKNDNRMLVNRLRAITMSRCWIQAKYKKENSNS